MCKKDYVALIALFLVSAGCAASKISSIDTNPYHHDVNTIAIGLDGDSVLSDAITASLKKRQFTVVDRVGVYEILSGSSINNSYTNDTTIVAYLKEHRETGENDIDAFLTTKNLGQKTNGRLQSATIYLYSVQSGNLILSFEWKNGWGGMPGSPADMMMSKGLEFAAEEIVLQLMNEL